MRTAETITIIKYSLWALDQSYQKVGTEVYSD